jgi:hypothetical protein
MEVSTLVLVPYATKVMIDSESGLTGTTPVGGAGDATTKEMPLTLLEKFLA